MEKYEIKPCASSKNNFKKLLKDGLEVISTTKTQVIFGKGLLRVVYDIATDEAVSQYILNK